MHRRSILRLLGFAPVAAPLAVAATARAMTEVAPRARTYAVSMEIEGQASAISLLSTRVATAEANTAATMGALRTLEISHPAFIGGPVTITA